MADKREGMTMSGFCRWPAHDDPEGSHDACHIEGCTCGCHEEKS